MNVPAIFVYGGTIKPGHYDGRDLTVVSVFEAVGQYSAHRGHMAPEAAAGAAIALVQERDLITIDADARLLQLNVPADELERRRSRWQPPAAQYTRGVLAKYAKLVSSSNLGAVTDGEPAQGNMSQFKAAP